MIKSISVRALRPNISQVIDDVCEKFDRYIISRHGHPQAIMLGIKDYESIMETLEIESDKELMSRIKKAEKEIPRGKGKDLNVLHKELGLV